MNTKFKSLTTAIIIVALLSGCEKQFTSKDSAAVHDAVGSLISDKPNIVMIVSDDIGYGSPLPTEAVLIPLRILIRSRKEVYALRRYVPRLYALRRGSCCLQENIISEIMGYGVLWIPPNEQLGTCCRMQVIQPTMPLNGNLMVAR